MRSPWAIPNDPRIEGRLPPCIPHEQVDCPICIAVAEAIVDWEIEHRASGPKVDE